MPVRKSATKASKAKKKAVKKTVKKAVRKPSKPAARKASGRTKAQARKPISRKAVRAAPKTKKKILKKKVAAAKPKKSRTASKTASARKVAVPRRAAKPAKSVKAVKPIKAAKLVKAVKTKVTRKPAARKAAPARSKGAQRPAAARGKLPKLVAVAPRFRPQLETVAADDDEGYEPDSRHGNLLLGPRNVKPYVPRKGEQYMGQDQLEHFRRILFNWKRDLMEEVDRTMTHMKDEAANPPDPNDRATLESEFALELRTRDRERKLIRKIDQALKRVDDGTYGYCLETGDVIGIKRLEARPVATLCIEAQERRERREKQYGDRDDWYR